MKNKILFILILITFCAILEPIQAETEAKKPSLAKPQEYFDYVFHLYQEKKFSQVIDELKLLLQYHPNHIQLPYIYIMNSNSYFQLGNFDQAKKNIKFFINKYPNHEAIGNLYYLQAQIYTNNFQNFNSVDFFFKALRHSKNDPFLLKKINNQLTSLIENNLTLNELKKALQICEDQSYQELILQQIIKKSFQENFYQITLEYINIYEKKFPEKQTRELIQIKQKISRYLGYKNKIALIGPFSGKYAFYGEKLLNASSSAINQFNQTSQEKIQHQIYDNFNNPIRTVKIIKEQIQNDNILAIVGPIRSTNSIAAAIIANELKIPIIAPTILVDNFSGLGPFVFQLSTPPGIQGEIIAEYAISKQNIKYTAIIAPDTHYGRSITNKFITMAQKLGTIVVDTLFYKKGQNDFSSEIEELKIQIATDTNYIHLIDSIEVEKKFKKIYNLDALFIPAQDLNEVLMLVPQAAANLIKCKFIGNRVWLNRKTLQMNPVFTKNCIIGSENKFETKSDSDPIYDKCYDATSIILNAFKEGNTNPSSIIEYIEKMPDHNGLSGKINLSKFNGANANLHFYTIEKNQFKLLE